VNLDERVLVAVADWEDRSPGMSAISVAEVAKTLGEEPVPISRALGRLLDAGQLKGQNVTTMGAAYRESYITGITSAGLREVERLRSQGSATGGHPAPLSGPPSVVINMSGGAIGSVSGPVLANIQNHLNAAAGRDAEEFRAAVTEVVNVIMADHQLGPTQRTNAVEAIEEVAVQGTLPETRRKHGVIAALLLGIPAFLENANQAAEAWHTYVPAIVQFFSVVKLP